MYTFNSRVLKRYPGIDKDTNVLEGLNLIVDALNTNTHHSFKVDIGSFSLAGEVILEASLPYALVASMQDGYNSGRLRILQMRLAPTLEDKSFTEKEVLDSLEEYTSTLNGVSFSSLTVLGSGQSMRRRIAGSGITDYGVLTILLKIV